MDELKKMVEDLLKAFDIKGFSLAKNKDGSMSTDLQSIILLCLLTKSETEELWVEQQLRQYDSQSSEIKQKMSREEFIKTTKHYYTEAISMFIAGLISSLEFPASVDYLLNKHASTYGIQIDKSKKVSKEEYDEYMKDDKPDVDPSKMN